METRRSRTRITCKFQWQDWGGTRSLSAFTVRRSTSFLTQRNKKKRVKTSSCMQAFLILSNLAILHPKLASVIFCSSPANACGTLYLAYLMLQTIVNFWSSLYPKFINTWKMFRRTVIQISWLFFILPYFFVFKNGHKSHNFWFTTSWRSSSRLGVINKQHHFIHLDRDTWQLYDVSGYE